MVGVPVHLVGDGGWCGAGHGHGGRGHAGLAGGVWEVRLGLRRRRLLLRVREMVVVLRLRLRLHAEGTEHTVPERVLHGGVHVFSQHRWHRRRQLEREVAGVGARLLLLILHPVVGLEAHLLVELTHLQSLAQRKDVVVRKPQSLDLGQLGVVGGAGQHVAQRVQRLVQAVHAVPLTVVRLDTSVLLELQDQTRTLGARPRLGVPALLRGPAVVLR